MKLQAIRPHALRRHYHPQHEVDRDSVAVGDQLYTFDEGYYTAVIVVDITNDYVLVVNDFDDCSREPWKELYDAPADCAEFTTADAARLLAGARASA